jgi:tetratricopeptide (TPR) repeat protein
MYGLARACRSLAVLVAMVALPGRAHADVVDEAWKRGNDAYFRGDLAAAVAAYEQLDRQGILSGDLYYNLGVTHFRRGNLGHAIWSFERAVAIDPADEDARFNLAQSRRAAERRVRDKIEGAAHDPFWIRAVTASAPSTQTWTFLGLYLGAFALLFWRRRAQEAARAVLAAGAALLGAAALVAALFLAGRAALANIPFGIVLPDMVAVKEGADPNHRSAFDVHAGLRVRLLDRDHEWQRIRLANGLEGWVRAQDVGPL